MPAGAAPSAKVAGDLFAISGTDSHLQFVDQNSNVQELAFLSDVTASNNSVAAEAARAQAAEAALGTEITTETGRATTAETNLATSISTETARAMTAEAAAVTTAEAFSANASNISTGTIGQAFLPSNVVFNNQANT